MTVEERIDAALDRIQRIGAKARRIVLSEADLPEVHGKSDYRGVPVVAGETGAGSLIQTDGAPSGDNTDFAI
jgi:hypothetical protein